ncbi:SH3 domain-containing protein, partial [Acinetobacter baumannii]|nr:SH3 domain-containing protein [Acinetobacter baumannii]
LLDYLHKFQKQNISFFKIFEKQEFIENFIDTFIKEDIDNFEEGLEPQEGDLNIFGEMILQEAEVPSDSSQDSSNDDTAVLINGILRILFIVCWF